MLNWKKIQELNLKEVATKTQIELDFLKALIKKDFVVLNRFNVKGFIKILSREYDLDFSDFNEEYEAYLNEHGINNPQINSKTITPKLDSYTQKTSSIWPFLIIIILGLIVGIIYYFDTLKTFFKDEQNNKSTTVIDIIDQAQENLKSLENNVIIIDNNKAQEANETETNQTNINNILPKQDILIQENEQNIENNISENNQTFINNENDIQKSNEETLNNNILKEAHFKTSTKIWVGLINLQTFKKTSFVREKDFNISLETDQLILTGAAALNVFDENNKEHKFPAGNSKRFLIKDGKITSISAAEFAKLNKGKEW